MFQIDKSEYEASRSQFVTLSSRSQSAVKGGAISLRSQFVTLKRGQHIKYLPYAFTEQGVAARKIDALENKYDEQFAVVFAAIKELITPPAPTRKQIGFHP
jgi:ORF6N domain